jgi:CCR4-NOT transcription complex subunit 4
MQHDYFGQFGKILKVVINRNSHYNSGPAPTVGAYVTFARKEDASAAVRGIGL